MNTTIALYSNDGMILYGKWRHGERHGRSAYLEKEQQFDGAWWGRGFYMYSGRELDGIRYFFFRTNK